MTQLKSVQKRYSSALHKKLDDVGEYKFGNKGVSREQALKSEAAYMRARQALYRILGWRQALAYELRACLIC